MSTSQVEVMNEPPEARPVIEADSLHKSYGDEVAVRNLSFSVRAGEVVGLLGPNGAGKTTTIKMLTTLLPLDAGAAMVDGFDVTTEPRSVRTSIGLAGQSAAVDEMLTPRENLELFGRLYKIRRSELSKRIEALIDRFRMTDYADRPVSTLSGGLRRRLDVVAALIADPPALFLDEPTTGLDPRSRSELWNAIEALAASGTAIVLTTQYLDEADRLADQIVMIDKGTVVATGTPKQLKQRLEREVLEIHLESDQDLARASATLGQLPGMTADRATREIHVPMAGGAAESLAVLRQLDEAGVGIGDFQLRRPTLDDVFLALTDPTE